MFAIFAWRIFEYALEVTRTGLATTVLELPQGPWWWVVAALFALCVPIQAVVVIERLARAIRGIPPDPAAGGGQPAESVA